MSKVLSLTGKQVTTLRSLLLKVDHLDDEQAVVLSQIVEKLDKPTQSKPSTNFMSAEHQAEFDKSHGWDPA